MLQLTKKNLKKIQFYHIEDNKVQNFKHSFNLGCPGNVTVLENLLKIKKLQKRVGKSTFLDHCYCS